MPAGMNNADDRQHREQRRVDNAALNMNMEAKNKGQLRGIGRQGPPVQARNTSYPAASQHRDPQQVVIHAKPKWLSDKETADVQANEANFQELSFNNNPRQKVAY